MAVASKPSSPVVLEPGPSAEDLAVLDPPDHRRRTWLLAGAGGLGVVLAVLALWGGQGTPTYETVSLTSGTLTRRVTAVGQLEPLDEVEIGSDLTGAVQEVNVDENDRVTSGQVLARLDPEPFESTVAQSRASAAASRANLDKARVDLARSEAELARLERLFARGAATQVERDESKLSVDAARATVAASRASLEQAEASLARSEQDLRDTAIVSPIDGVVLRRLVEEGQTVVSAMSATPLFEVASDLGRLKVEVDVDEADVGLVQAGQKARFTVTTWPDQTFDATVESVDLAANDDASVVIYGTELRVANPEGLLRPGMTATAEIEVGSVTDAWLVPTYALRYRPERRRDTPAGDHLWTLSGDELVPVSVRVGGSDGSVTAVYGEGLSEGLAVVVGGVE